MREVALDAARRLALRAQHLLGPKPAPTSTGVLRLVRDIGYLQVDPTNVVARSHLLVLWSRLGRYDSALLDRLLWRERRLFEYASLLLPTEDLPLHRVRMLAARRPTTARGRRIVEWTRRNNALRREVLARLRRHDGPLPLEAFEDRAVTSWRSTGWTNDRNVAQMFEFLWRQGHVTVAGRASGRRLWALAERWLPPIEALPRGEAERRGTERAVRALGIATERQLRSSYAFARLVTAHALAGLERDGRVARVELAGARGPWFVHRADLPLLDERDVTDAGHATLLSPFDNLIIDRTRTELLFGFRYRMEMYVPKAERRYGYFAMPILLGDRLVGRLDPRVDRANGRLLIESVHAEPAAPATRAAARAIRRAVEDLSAFVGADEIRWPRALPRPWARDLRA